MPGLTMMRFGVLLLAATAVCADTAPTAPNLVSPADGAALPAGSVTFVWAASAGTIPITYSLYLNPFFPECQTTTTSCTVAVGGAGMYSWFVQARNAAGSATSQLRSFTVVAGCTAPGVVSAPVPADGAAIATATGEVTLRWSPPTSGSAPMTFDVFLGTESQAKICTTTSSECLASGLTTSPATEYRWHVVASNACGSTAGPEWRFRAECGDSGPPVAAFDWSPDGPLTIGGTTVQQPYVGQSVTFHDRSSGNPTSWQWKGFGVEPGATFTSASPTFTWGEPGPKDVTLTASNCRGASAAVTRTVTVYPDTRPVIAEMTWNPPLPVPGQPVLLTASTGAAVGEPTGFEWDLGDGTTASGPSVRHAYRCAGTHTVTLVARRGSVSGTATRALVVGGAGCVDTEHIGEWVPIGPDVGYVGSIAIAPGDTSRLLIGTGGGLFRSSDSAFTWERVYSFDSGFVLNPIAFDPSRPQTCYAAPGQRRMLKSVDGGATWFDPGDGTAPGVVSWIEVDRQTPSVIWVTSAKKVLRSDDGGMRWTSVALSNANAIAVDGDAAHTVYVATSQGVKRSRDGGTTWESANNGLIGLDVRQICSTAVPGTLYAGVWGWGVFRTTNGGQMWENVFSGGGNDRYPYALAVGRDTPTTVTVGVQLKVFTSGDGGSTWHEGSGSVGWYSAALAVDPGDARVMYLGTDAGLFKSTDRGLHWQLASEGIKSAWVRRLRFSPDGARLLAPTGGAGLHVSVDKGETWQPYGGRLLGEWVWSAAVDWAHPEHALLGGDWYLLRTTDGGASWSVDSLVREGNGVLDILMDPGNGQRVFVASAHGVYASTDGGATWTLAANGLPAQGLYALVADPRSSLVMLALSDQRLVYKSVDGGQSWVLSSAGLPTEFPGLEVPGTLAADPSVSGTVYAATSHGVFKSLDFGDTWSRASGGLPRFPISAFCIDPTDSRRVYAGTLGEGVYGSVDGGASWSKLGLGLGSYTTSSRGSVFSLVVDPQRPWVLFAGTEGQGVCRLQLSPTCAPPASLTVSAADRDACERSGITVRWTAPSDWGDGGAGTRSFDVLRGGGFLAHDLPASTVSYLDTGTVAGQTYSYTVRAANGCGLWTSLEVPAVSATDATGGRPRIFVEPADVRVAAGAAATLTVVVAGASTLQWYEGDAGDTSRPVAGATGQTLVTPPLSASARYWLRARNGCGAVDSRAATVTVAATTSRARKHLPRAGGG